MLRGRLSLRPAHASDPPPQLALPAIFATAWIEDMLVSCSDRMSPGPVRGPQETAISLGLTISPLISIERRATVRLFSKDLVATCQDTPQSPNAPFSPDLLLQRPAPTVVYRGDGRSPEPIKTYRTASGETRPGFFPERARARRKNSAFVPMSKATSGTRPTSRRLNGLGRQPTMLRDSRVAGCTRLRRNEEHAAMGGIPWSQVIGILRLMRVIGEYMDSTGSSDAICRLRDLWEMRLLDGPVSQNEGQETTDDLASSDLVPDTPLQGETKPQVNSKADPGSSVVETPEALPSLMPNPECPNPCQQAKGDKTVTFEEMTGGGRGIFGCRVRNGAGMTTFENSPACCPVLALRLQSVKLASLK
ncbi:hypothetical protein HIM_04211 [Hirsutella minnesotensis 3608]|uniref:Uncharacterized protein n=1 Tax=Hirsutella minnesotensis 3608 TaxID=1043627 RepID=A0A0F8A1S7_9HYPO|nr:hypothetical protein HIM_04211 [Hirsutella minnesotensis 3608]